MSRKGCLEPWQSYSWKWENGCNLDVETTPDAIELFYTISRNSLPGEKVHIKIALSRTACNYGGECLWFRCPSRGCGRRVARLYLAGKYFLCRHCHDLAYSSQREGKEFRLMNKARKIYRRLGVNSYNDLFLEPKPKGMHLTTYEQLVNRAQEFESEALRAACIRFKII
jgi:hypothetical protein